VRAALPDSDKIESPKKRPAKPVPPEPRPKVTKAKVKAEVKRIPKSQPKEQPWNDDSPFMPVATPKR